MLLVLLALGCGRARVAVAGPDESWKGPDGLARAQAWFEGLGFPDLRYAPFVQVDSPRPDHLISPSPFFGFLLEENDRSVRIFTLELRVHRWPRGDVQLKRLGLDAAMREGLASYRESRVAHSKDDGMPRHDVPLSPLAYLVSNPRDSLFLACICAMQGHESRARELWETPATRIRSARWGMGLVWFFMKRNLCLDFADGERTWAEHLAAHRLWAGRFPDLVEVRARIPVLERMAAAERASAAGGQGLPRAASPDARASALVDRLVDPDAQWTSTRTQLRRDGTVAESVDEDPAEALVHMGDAAIPRLIEALTDDRIVREVVTVMPRSVSSMPGSDSIHAVRIGDVVLAILFRITGVDFSFPSPRGRGRIGDLDPDGSTLGGTEEGRVVQRRAQEWWAARKGAASAPAGTPGPK